MTDIYYFEETMAGDISAIRTLLQNFPTNDLKKATAIYAIEDKIKKANGTKQSFKMECRLVSDPVLKKKYELVLQQRMEELAQLESDLKALQDEQRRNELFLNAEDGAADGTELGDKMIGEMNLIQDKTQSSIDNTRNMIADAKEVGLTTLEELHRQNEQIAQIDEDVDRLEDNLQRADKLLKNFGKRMATDKFIRCFALVNFILLLSFIIYAKVKKKGFVEDEDNTALPPPPAISRIKMSIGLY